MAMKWLEKPQDEIRRQHKRRPVASSYDEIKVLIGGCDVSQVLM
jgi:hypothetical protein